MNISFSKNTILYIIVLIVSVVLTIYGATGRSRAKEITDIAELSIATAEKGQYVDLTNLQIQTYDDVVDGLPVSMEIRDTRPGITKDEHYALAALSDGRYIYVVVKDSGDGDVNSIKDTTGVIGHIVGAPNVLPASDVYALKDPNAIVQEVVIKELDVEQRNVTLYPGVFFFILSIILLIKDKPY